MNPFEMVVAIVAITAIASVLRTLFGGGRAGRNNEKIMRHIAAMNQPQHDPEAERLRGEVHKLKERVAVLERLITDQSTSLDREFEKLKQMD